MDESNQFQNPNMSMPGQQMGPMPAPSMPPSTGGNMPTKGKSMLLWIIIVIILAVAGAAWWYINNMVVEPIVGQQPQINQEAREDIMLNKDIQEADLGDLDKEFQAVDNDLNSL